CMEVTSRMVLTQGIVLPLPVRHHSRQYVVQRWQNLVQQGQLHLRTGRIKPCRHENGCKENDAPTREDASTDSRHTHVLHADFQPIGALGLTGTFQSGRTRAAKRGNPTALFGYCSPLLYGAYL